MIKVLLGPNGAGKSTYLRKLMGLEDGRVSPSTAMVFQEPLLFDLTVSENIALGLKFRGDKNIKEKSDYWLQRLGIMQLKDRKATTLSGGEAQKVSLARALILEPQTLLLDEPLANLDLPSQIKLREELKDIIEEKRISAVWVTHNKAEALALGDYLMIMIDREIVQEGHPEDVVQRPKTEKIASFLGIDNIFHGDIRRSNGRSFFQNQKIRFEVVSEAKASAWVIVHPEDIILSPNALRGTSARNCLAGKIEEVNSNGLIFKIKIDAGESFVVNITRAAAEELSLSLGNLIYLTFKATAVQIL